MATTGTKTEQTSLPQSATITISGQKPNPPGLVEVTPNGGRVYFENKDSEDYRLRLWPVKNNTDPGIDILLPAGGNFAVAIKPDDEFMYSVIPINSLEKVSTNGPIKN
jgi:hypothetical protein